MENKTSSVYVKEGISPYTIWVYSLEKNDSSERITVLSRRYMKQFCDKYDPFRIRNFSFDFYYGKRVK